MAEDFNAQTWGPSQYRIDANNKVESIQRVIDQVNREIKVLTEKAFTEKSTDRATAFSDDPRALNRLHKRLEQGDVSLRGNIVTGHEYAKIATAELARRILEKEDLLASRTDYDRLIVKALRAERAHPKERGALIADLKNERDYCDSNFRARQAQHGRDWSYEGLRAREDGERERIREYDRDV